MDDNSSDRLPRGPSSVSFADIPFDSAPEKVRHILSEGEHNAAFELDETTSLFTQLDVLVHFKDGSSGWKEISRWLKYEETVEVGDRWSKPHVSTTSMHGVLHLKKALMDGSCVVGLGLPMLTRQTIADVLSQLVEEKCQLSNDVCQNIRHIILNPHKHKHRKSLKRQSLSDSRSSLITAGSVHEETDASDHHNKERRRSSILRRRSGDGTDIASALYQYPSGANPNNLAPYKPNRRLSRKLPKNCEAANILVGQVDFLDEVVMAFCRLETPCVMADLTEVDVPTRYVFLILGPLRARSSDNTIWLYSDIARAMASLLNDKIFCQVAYRASTVQDLLDGIDEYIDGVTILPPSIWDPATRLEPPKRIISTDQILQRLDESNRGVSAPHADEQEEGAGDDQSLKRTGRFFGGFVNDIRHRYPLYLSDLKDVLHPQCIASTVFLFFACITPIVTFGGLLGKETDGYMGTIECLLAGALCGTLYALFAGQPLTLVGSTGPMLIFENILYRLSHDNDIAYMSFRFWIGIWIAIILLLIVAFDLSALVRYITRFTEESFAVLVSLIFVYEAFAKTIEIWSEDCVRTGTAREDDARPWLYECFCRPTFNNTSQNVESNDTETAICPFSPINELNWTESFDEECITYQDRLEVRVGCLSEADCLSCSWNLTGDACYRSSITQSVPDVFFVSVILFLGTFTLAIALRAFRNSRFFPSVVRATVADFAVFLSIVAFTGIDYGLGLTTPKLEVPSEFKPTKPDRGWLINPMDVDPWWLILVAVLPAALATILVFLDQQITSVIINRKEHKLKKGHGYHLDLFVLAILIALCSVVGLPWFVAATVQAISHVQSLMRESDVKIPGERPQIVGVREQRMTGFIIHVLIGLSTLLTAVLRLIPMPVLYGVFLYMGFTSLVGVQFIQRLLIVVMPVKYQPDYIFLRHVKLSRVHIFTAIQFVCMALMWVVKTIKITAIGFPLMLIALMLIRKLMDLVFTQSDLYWLDHLLPDEARRHKEDEAAKKSHPQAADYYPPILKIERQNSTISVDTTSHISFDHVPAITVTDGEKDTICYF
jgi:anion exchange protein